MINSLQAFDQIYIMTKGGPGPPLRWWSYLIYMNAFQYFKQGYASAMAYILFIIIFVASIIQLKISERDVLEEVEIVEKTAVQKGKGKKRSFSASLFT